MLVLRLLAERWIGGVGTGLIGLALVGVVACDGTAPEVGPSPAVVETPTSQPTAGVPKAQPDAAEMSFPGDGSRDEEGETLLDWESLSATPLQGWPGVDPDQERLLGAPLIVMEERVLIEYEDPPFGLIPTDIRANFMLIPLYVPRPGDFRLLEPWVPTKVRSYFTRRTEEARPSSWPWGGDANEAPSPQAMMEWLEQLKKQLPPDVFEPEGQANNVDDPPMPDEAEQ